jgi:cyanophycin synthetase
VVYSAAGDRRDCDMIRQGELLGDAFDRVILYEDHYARGRADGEIISLFRRGLTAATRTMEIQEFRGNLKAIESALRTAQPGELVVVQADVIDETLDYIGRYLACNDASREIDLRQALEASTNGAVFYAAQVTD